MLDPQASRFWQAAILSGLMDVEGLTACWDAIAPAKREDPEHIDRRLARQAVQIEIADALAGTATPGGAEQRVQG